MKKTLLGFLLPLMLAGGATLDAFAGHRGHHRNHHYHPGYRIDHLPSRHHRLFHDRRDYFYSGGHFYRPHNHHYEVVVAPIGARVPYLPPGYVSFYMGPRRYFYANYTYYLWDHHQRDYIVVREPDGAEELVVNQADNVTSEIYAYPSQGQSPEQQERDYYDCHVWSAGESDYDPTLEGQNVYRFRDYRRAMTACLEGRGYSVR
jgi:Family of unknown function (DUF6515)